MISYDYDAPEDFITVPLEAGFPINAITCVIARTEAVVLLLHEQFDGTNKSRPKDPNIANALWSVEGDLQMLKTLIEAAYQSTRQEGAE